MKCKHCGAETADGSKFCTECGQKVMRERTFYDPFPELDEYRRIRNKIFLFDEHSKALNIYCFVMMSILTVMIICGFIFKLDFLSSLAGIFMVFILLMLWANNRQAKRIRFAIARPLVVIMPLFIIMTIYASVFMGSAESSFDDSFGNSDIIQESIDENDNSLVYEAFFLDNDEVTELFTKVRGMEAPYEKLTKDFHVTTAYMPEQDMSELYGTEVTVHIYAYKDGEVLADDGSMTSNEGFFCTVTSDNEEMQSFIDNTQKNWHITGSYKDGAKYTEYIDPSDATEVDISIKGRFGAGMSDGSIKLGCIQ